MEKSFIFNSINGDRKMKAEDFRKYFSAFIGNGIYPNPATRLQVVSHENLKILVQSGEAYINGSYYINTDDLVLSIDPADSVLDRIDRIVIRMDILNRNITCQIKKGTFSSAPTAIELQRDEDAYELCLADIYISKGSIDITQSMIKDTRLDPNLCGIVTGVIDQVDTSEIYRQLQADIEEKGLTMQEWINEAKNYFTNEFYTWFDEIKNILDGDVAGNLARRILALEEKVGSGLTADNILMQNGSTVETSICDLQKELNGQRIKAINIHNRLDKIF